MKDFLDRLKGLGVFITPADEVERLIQMTKSYDGYDRELAVRRLGDLGSPLAIPALLNRVNDWVPQVRRAALVALNGLLRPGHAQAVIDSLPAVQHLKHCGRADHTAFISSVFGFLLGDKNRGLVLNGIAHSNPQVARICVRLCLENELAQSSPLRPVACNIRISLSVTWLQLCLVISAMRK